MKISTAEFIKNYGSLADKALPNRSSSPRTAVTALSCCRRKNMRGSNAATAGSSASKTLPRKKWR